MFCSICPKFINNEPCQDHIEYCEFELSEHDDKIRAKVLEEIEKLYVEKAKELTDAYNNDRENVPKPTFESSVALVVAICERLKPTGK